MRPILRIVLARHPRDGWRLYRQPQWIGEVRRDPSAARWPRYHFDLDASAYQSARDGWNAAGAPDSLPVALAELARRGATAVTLSTDATPIPTDSPQPDR